MFRRTVTCLGFRPGAEDCSSDELAMLFPVKTEHGNVCVKKGIRVALGIIFRVQVPPYHDLLYLPLYHFQRTCPICRYFLYLRMLQEKLLSLLPLSCGDRSLASH
jgi:hypothetical protein